MDINENLIEKIKGFPRELQEVATMLLKEIERGKPKTKIIETVKNEIREMVLEEE